MARDYAGPDRRRPGGARGLPGWIWLVAGLSLGLVVAVGVYIGRPAEPMPMAKARPEPVAPAKRRIEIPPAEEPRFGFYTMLENEQVVVSGQSADVRPSTPQPSREVAPSEPASAQAPAESAPAEPAPARNAPPEAAEPPAPTTTASSSLPGDRYIVLAGSFGDSGNAERRKAALALAGIESSIEQVTGRNEQTFHRVRIGPRDNLASAEAVLRQLQINGFDGRVIRQR